MPAALELTIIPFLLLIAVIFSILASELSLLGTLIAAVPIGAIIWSLITLLRVENSEDSEVDSAD